MVNCNPETVSTDYDTSDRLYFEPLTAEDVLEIIETTIAWTVARRHRAVRRQTPLKLAEALERAEIPILGTSSDMIDLAEDRDRFKKLLNELDLRQPTSGIATSPNEARAIAEAVGYPIVIRPSTCWADAPWRSCSTPSQLDRYLARLANDLRPALGAGGLAEAPRC